MAKEYDLGGRAPYQSEIGWKLYLLGKQNFAKNRQLPVIERGSDEWHAWRRWRMENGEPVGFMERQERWTVPAKWPPVGDDWWPKDGGQLKGKFAT